MSILSQLLTRTRPTDSIADPSGFLLDYYGGAESATGQRVNAATALRVVAVFACIRIGAETVGSLPLRIFERKSDGSKVRAVDHPYYTLLHDSPNAEMTSLEWRETQQGHVEGRGNGYAQLVWGGDGRIAEIIPLASDRMTPRRARGNTLDLTAASAGDGRLVWQYQRPQGGERIFEAHEILPVHCFGSTGLLGYSPIAQAREAIGIALAAEQSWAKFFSAGAISKIALEHPRQLSPQAVANLQRSFAEHQTGHQNAHKPIIAEEGMKVVNLPVSFDDLQFLETRKFQVAEIARLFRIPPHMIGDLEKATFSNIEQQSLEFVIHSILPRIARWEQRLNRHLFAGRERGRYFAEFSLDGLLRGDIKSRYEALAIARRNGIINGNDWADLENLNHFPGGDIRIVEASMTRLEQVGQNQSPARSQAAAPDARSVLAAFRPVLDAALGRSLRRESKALAALAKKPASDRAPALAQFYEEHRAHLRDQLGPILTSLASLRSDPAAAGSAPARATDLAAGVCARHLRLAEESAAAGTLAAAADAWEQARAESLAAEILEKLTS